MCIYSDSQNSFIINFMSFKLLNRFLRELEMPQRHFAREANKAVKEGSSKPVAHQPARNFSNRSLMRRSDWDVPMFNWSMNNWPYFVWSDFDRIE